MSGERVERRRAAILAVDVAGSKPLSGTGSSRTLCHRPAPGWSTGEVSHRAAAILKVRDLSIECRQTAGIGAIRSMAIRAGMAQSGGLPTFASLMASGKDAPETAIRGPVSKPATAGVETPDRAASGADARCYTQRTMRLSPTDRSQVTKVSSRRFQPPRPSASILRLSGGTCSACAHHRRRVQR
jgi:hypothetical protein